METKTMRTAGDRATPVEPPELRAVLGTWYNQHGSELVLESSGERKLSGYFKSRSGLAKGGERCAVTGYVAGDLVAFVVDFGRFDSLTAWTGHFVIESDEPRIRACWHMSVKVPLRHADDELWRGTWTGEDEFRRAPFGAREWTGGSHPLPDWP
jgi:hypothetical protein